MNLFNNEEYNPTNKTPSELLIDIMQHFPDAEPSEIVIVWTDENKDIQAIGNVSLRTAIGMLRCGTIMAEERFKDARLR